MQIRRAMVDLELGVGEIVGPYRIVTRVAGGAYRAVHVERPQRVAIVVGSRDGWREAAVHMLRSARMVEALGHPGVATIVARGVLADQRPWMATEVPSGIALWDLVARRTMPPAEVAALVHDIADVLAHAHLRGIVHRGLTLRAVVLATGPRAYPLCVADWGASAEDLGVYAAPEGNERGDGRVDVYALGVIAYRAALGKFPRMREEDGRRVLEVGVLPGLPTGIAMLIARMLAADPAERPTAIEVRALARELLGAGEQALEAQLAEAVRARASTPDLAPFHDDTPRPGDDVAYAPMGPRFSKPKWTPAPPLITSETSSNATGEIEIKKD